MKTHLFALILATVPLALTAQAREISIDAGDMHPGSGAAAYTSDAGSDCASARSITSQDATSRDNHARSGSAGSPGTRMRVSDETAGESGVDSTRGSSAPGKSQAVPVKPRSTRWQSLVPGAIK